MTHIETCSFIIMNKGVFKWGIPQTFWKYRPKTSCSDGSQSSLHKTSEEWKQRHHCVNKRLMTGLEHCVFCSKSYILDLNEMKCFFLFLEVYIEAGNITKHFTCKDSQCYFIIPQFTIHVSVELLYFLWKPPKGWELMVICIATLTVN